MWPFTKETKFNSSTKRTSGVKPVVIKLSYAAAGSGRIFNWQSASDRSADRNIKSALAALRRRSRELIQNELLAKRYISLVNTQVLGRQGIKLQMKARNPDGVLDIPANGEIETLWNEWGRCGGPNYSGCEVTGSSLFWMSRGRFWTL